MDVGVFVIGSSEISCPFFVIKVIDFGKIVFLERGRDVTKTNYKIPHTGTVRKIKVYREY